MTDRTTLGSHFELERHTSPGPGMKRVVALEAALELLHAAAIVGAFTQGDHDETGERIAANIEPLADAIEKAWTSRT